MTEKIRKFENLSIIIPAYNEEAGIKATLETLLREFPESEIIVVDDASKDATADVVRAFPGVRLYRHRFNKGYGGAVKTGMRKARKELVAWFDADNEHRPECLKEIVIKLEDEKLAAVLGERAQSVNRLRGMGKFFIRMLARILKVKSGSDLNCGLRVFRRDVITKYLNILPDTYSASLTSTMVMIELRYPFAFHPVTLNPRIGNSKVALADGFNTMLLVLRIITLFAPMRIFLRLSFLLLGTGLIYSLYVAIKHHQGIPALGAMVFVSGIIIGGVGLLADQISQIRITSLATLDAEDDANEGAP